MESYKVVKTGADPPRLPREDHRIILYFAIGLWAVSFVFLFAASFVPASRSNQDIIKLVLPFIFSIASGLTGFYWGAAFKKEQ